MSDMYGAIISGLTDVGNAFVAHHAAKEAWHRQKTMMKNAVRWRMQDMQRAGLNPILAAGATPGSYSAAQMSTAGIGEGARAAGNILAQHGTRQAEIKLREQETQNAEENRKLMRASGIKALADANSAQEQADYIHSKRVDELPAVINNLGAQAGLSSAHAQKLGQDFAIDELGRMARSRAESDFYSGHDTTGSYRYGQVELPFITGGVSSAAQTFREFFNRSSPTAPYSGASGITPTKSGRGY